MVVQAFKYKYIKYETERKDEHSILVGVVLFPTPHLIEFHFQNSLELFCKLFSHGLLNTMVLPQNFD